MVLTKSGLDIPLDPTFLTLFTQIMRTRQIVGMFEIILFCSVRDEYSAKFKNVLFFLDQQH